MREPFQQERVVSTKYGWRGLCLATCFAQKWLHLQNNAKNLNYVTFHSSATRGNLINYITCVTQGVV